MYLILKGSLVVLLIVAGLLVMMNTAIGVRQSREARTNLTLVVVGLILIVEALQLGILLP